MNLTEAPKLILGARYKHLVQPMWPLTKQSYWAETSKCAFFQPLPVAATEPRSVRPPIELVTRGVNNGFGTGPIMGTDPEVFVSKDGKRVPAFEVLPDKDTAKHAEVSMQGYYGTNWFWDGYQAETTVQAVGCHTSLAHYWQYQLRKLSHLGLRVHPGSVWKVPEMSLGTAGDAEVGLGCSPSYNAYGMHGRVVENARALKYRFAGGHIHFGVNLKELEELGVSAPYIVKALDCFLGVPSVALFQNYDSPIRRRYYGLAGEFRTPKHGLEYRTLSNGWCLHPQAFQLVMDLARHAFNLGRTRLRRIWVGREELVRDIINYNDARSARDLMKLNKAFYDSWLQARYGGSKSFWAAINGGIEAAIPDFGKDVHEAWGTIALWGGLP
jgi:hypothetical protein